MSPHPDPPADPSTLRLLVRRVSYPWWRIHAKEFDAAYFGKVARNRFDAPAGEFGVMYVARDAHGAFVETFGHATGVRFVTETELRAREVSGVTCSRPLRLVDLRANGLARLGADAELTSGPDWALARRWAKALYDHPRQPDGILYRARHDPARVSAALFDRVARDLQTRRSPGRCSRPITLDFSPTFSTPTALASPLFDPARLCRSARLAQAPIVAPARWR